MHVGDSGPRHLMLLMLAGRELDKHFCHLFLEKTDLFICTSKQEFVQRGN